MVENIIYLIVGLFFGILIVKSLVGKRGEKICAICSAFALTWIVLLMLYYIGKYDNLLLIGLLMGLSILGVYYTWETYVSKEKTLFRLPVLLGLVLLGYYLLTLENLIKEFIILFILWMVFGIFYFYRNNYETKSFIDKIVECCKKW